MRANITPMELDRWANLLHGAVTGKWLTVRCRDYRACRRNFDQCHEICDAIGLAHVARRSSLEIVIGDGIRDGGIDFRTSDMDRRRDGDPR